MQFHHICIQTDQYKESLEFYVDILGFKLIKETPDFHSRQYNSWLEQDGFFIELQTNKAGGGGCGIQRKEQRDRSFLPGCR